MALLSAVLGAAVALSGCDTISDLLGGTEGTGPSGADAASALPDEGEQIPYTTDLDFKGEAPDEVRILIRASSQLTRLEEKPPPTLASLERRVKQDEETFTTALRSEGFYASTITHEIDAEARPVRVNVVVDSGPAYRLAAYDIRYARPGEDKWLWRDPSKVGVELNQRARSEVIVEGQTRLLRHLADHGYPLAAVGERKAVVDHDRRVMTVTLDVDQGALSSYGPIAVEGSGSVRERYVRRLVPLAPGKRYRQDEVERARQRLAETNLFNTIAIEHAATVDAQGNLPMTVKLAEREHRTIGGGANYSTSEGFGAEVYWEHRNLFGQNEKLRATVVGSEIEQSGKLDFRSPHVWGTLDQNLLGSLALARRTTDAYDELSAGLFGGIERRFGKYWKFSAGGSVEYAVIDENLKPEETTLTFGIPITASRDDSDDLLNPTRGSRLAFTLTPYISTIDSNAQWISATAGGSTYVALDDDKRYVIAGRARLGTSFGADTLEIPATKRFYAGGGGSIRGYEYQHAGPLDDDNEPIGGRSLLELGLEARIRITDTIGIVPFVDAGTVYDEVYPDNADDILIAAGLGGRYFTAFGPFRVDVAFPLNGRKSDDSWQLYVSLGQAF